MNIPTEETEKDEREPSEEVEEERMETEAEAKSDDGVGENVSDSDDDDDDDDDLDADEAEVRSLQILLRENPYDYASHVALIKKLREMENERYRLQDARQNMSNAYPLSPELWLSWMRDEMKLATTPEERVEVTQLCERAVDDYVSVEVWLEYLQFNIGNMGSEKDAAKHVRKLFERALTVIGLHTTKGAIIWEAYREFETVLLALIDSAKAAERKEQLERIANLFERQLAYPLLNMEKTYKEYQCWREGDGAEADKDDDIISREYDCAFAKLSSLLPYEEKVISAHGKSELLDAYKGYLLYEKQQHDRERIVLLYERAITDLSLETSIWLDYLNYLEDTVRDKVVVLQSVYKRASRNIPWCSKVWLKWMRSSEMWGEHAMVQKLFEQALTSGFSTAEDYRNVWLAYLEHQRRKIEECSEEQKEMYLDVVCRTFDKACERLANDFGLNGDPNCVILQYWARTEAIHANNMEKARTLWADILSQGHSAKASFWLEYISLERCYGDAKHLRKLFQKALTSVKDWPESIANAWIDFERDKGTLEQIELCEAKTQERMDKVVEERQKEQEVSTQSESFTRDKRALKRKSDDTGKWKHLGNVPTKIVKSSLQAKSKLHENLSDTVDEMMSDKGKETSKSIAPPPGFKAEDKHMDDKDSEHEMDNSVTVFISNLDYTATEEEVRDALKPAGSITSFKMMIDHKGRSKGYCYVQLSDAAAVEEALKLDRTPIKGRPMFVSRYDANKNTRSSGFKYSSTLEKNKLFIKGLPLTTTKEELEEIFQVHGDLKEVRLVTYRNGHSKGLAYVEYRDETIAAKALLASDGMRIQDKVISVAISQPPDRKKTSTTEEDKKQVKSLGGTTVSRTAFGLPKTLLPMVPRNVKVSSSNGSTTGNGVAQSMSNQDFRNMFLKKK